MRDQSLVYTLDEALSTIRFGKFQGLVLAYAGLGWTTEAMEVMILSFVGPTVQSVWGLSSSEESMITTVVFAGMLIGAFLWGFVSDTYGRKKSFLGATILSTGAGFLSAFSPNYIVLLILRCLVGIGLGGGHVFTTWFLEFVPSPNRGTWMIIFSSFWTLGTIFEASLAWFAICILVTSLKMIRLVLIRLIEAIVMPGLGWRWLLALSSLPSFVVLLLYGCTPESPRYLCAKGRTSEAHDVLEKAARLNQTELPPGRLVSDSIMDLNDDFASPASTHLLSSFRKKTQDSETSPSSLFILFSPKLIRTTFLLWFLYFANTFSYYGIILLTSQLSSGHNECTSIPMLLKNNGDADLYVDVFITSLAEIPGLVLSAFIVDRVGRKLSMAIMFAFGFVLLLPLVIHQQETLTTTSLFGARMFVSATFIVACIYAPEVHVFISS
ncbi:unnamed protein product [Ilex paraguariensis]|uniref:Major facilitator superfamily (MFS) profile domain-containing protein n=2 Tax=Ilex paraguariensis TaxID=185542 RepID=A0ABC8V2U2_9AQUA